MKKLFILLTTLGILIISCNNNKNEKNQNVNNREKDNYMNGKNDENQNNDDNNKNEWSASDIRKFNTECQKSLENEGVDQTITDKICPCVLKKVSSRYSSFTEADAIGNTSAIEKMTKDCVTELGIGNNNNTNNDDDQNNTGGN